MTVLFFNRIRVYEIVHYHYFVGRRVAELQIHIAVAQLMKNFRVEFRDDHPVGYVQQILIYPDRRMDLAFIALK